MDIILPSAQIEGIQTWAGTHVEAIACYHKLNKIYPMNSRDNITRFNTLSGNLLDTLVNPHIHAMLLMLHADNIDNSTRNRLQITYSTLALREREMLQDLKYNATIAREQASLHIHRVTLGATLLTQLNAEKELKTVSLALQRSAQHRIRVIQLTPNVIEIYTNVWSWELMQKITALLPTLFPGVYSTISEHTQQALVQLSLSEIEKFNRHFNNWLNSTSYLKDQELNKLVTFLDAQRTLDIEEVNAQIRTIREGIERKYNDIAIAQRNLMSCNQRLNGLNNQNKIDRERATEFLDFIKHYKGIRDFSTEQTKLNLTITTPLKYVAQDALEDLYLNSSAQTHVIKTLLKETFIDEKYEIHTTSLMILDLANNNVTKGNNLGASDGATLPEYFPHPHIMQHNCWGDNRPIINQALQEGDLEKAIAQCVATNMNLNVIDSTVTKHFIHTLQTTEKYKKCIKNIETGEWLNLIEYRDMIERRDQ